MPDIFHHFQINAPVEKVFWGFSTPEGLSTWWSKSASGSSGPGGHFDLDFGPGYQWKAQVMKYQPPSHIEMKFTVADSDWLNTEIQVDLEHTDAFTNVRFCHAGWPYANEHFRISSYCWAMYLRILKRYLEHGEEVAYERRLEV